MKTLTKLPKITIHPFIIGMAQGLAFMIAISIIGALCFMPTSPLHQFLIK